MIDSLLQKGLALQGAYCFPCHTNYKLASYITPSTSIIWPNFDHESETIQIFNPQQ